MAAHTTTGFRLDIQAEPNSVQGAFLRRAVKALERISANAPADALASALAASTDAGSLAQLLSRADLVGPAIAELDPFVPALARNVDHRQSLLERAGGSLSAEEAGKVLGGISRQAVDKRRRAGAVLALREASDWRYPVCQFQDGEVIDGIADVVKGLSEQGPWATLDFLLAPDTVLGGQSPLEALRAGQRDAVRRLVRAESADGFA